MPPCLPLRWSAILFTSCILSLTAVTGQQVHAHTGSQATTQSAFTHIQIVGERINSGDRDGAYTAAFNYSCDTAIKTLSQSEALNDFLPGILLQNHITSSGCNALQGNSASADGIISGFQDSLTMALIQAGQQAATLHNIPFLSNLEIEGGISKGDALGSITSIQPLWSSTDERNHVFSQISWYREHEQTTLNFGLAARRLNEDQTVLWGINGFFDHAPERNHNRASIGADVQTSQAGVAVNYYVPLSGWKSVDTYTEEKAASGWDFELMGRLPEFPSWTAYVKGFQWDSIDEDTNRSDDVYGAEANLEYSPIPAFTVRGGIQDDTGSDVSAELALRFNIKFDQPLDLQFKPRTGLTPVTDRVYDKVRRENTIRVMQRRKEITQLTVLESIGANSVSFNGSSQGLQSGMTLNMPSTLTIANTVGAIATLRFADGAILKAGQNTQVTVEANQITLIQGIIEYISGGVSRVVNVPGGTITLLGTDIDVIANGGISTVRVRQGAVLLNNSVTLQTGEFGTISNGSATTLAANTATAIQHGDTASAKLDLIGKAQTGAKIAPYALNAPRLLTGGTAPGDIITIGLKFNTAVTASGGTPGLTMTVGSNTRTALLSAGSGSDDLTFSYTLQAGDAGVSSITVTNINLNGATLSASGLNIVTTIADTTLALSGTVDSCNAPSPAPGTPCFDGTVFAGFSPDGGFKMFTTTADTGGGPWGTNGTPVQTFLTSTVTGRSNTQSLALGGAQQDSSTNPGIQSHQAAEACSSLVTNGRTDWYLAAYDELQVLYTNRVAIGGFSNSEYWSSTEVSIGNARPLDFTNGGTTSFRAKGDFRPFRCVRREG